MMDKLIHTSRLKKLVLIFFALLPFMAEAQLTINAQLPPAGMVQKEQLWNLILISTKADIIEASIKMTLKDITGQELMTANTGNIFLQEGVKVLADADLQPVAYNYNTPELSGEFLPMGTYVVCYQVYRMVGEAQVTLGSECVNFTIDPLSPPLLNFPDDKSKVPTPYPFFSWMPPAPMDMFNYLTYDLIIAEVAEGQSPAEAVEYNIPVYFNTNIIQTNENYPASFTKLDTGKMYAWQVIAKNGLSYAAKTAVWTFSLDSTVQAVVTPPAGDYLLLDNDLKGVYIITGKQLHIKYASSDKRHTGTVIFSDAKGNVVDTINETLVPGDNYIDIALKNSLRKNEIYTVTLSDIEGNNQSIVFSIK